MVITPMSVGASAVFVPDAGSGLAGRATLVVVLLTASSAIWWFARRWASRFRPVHRRPGTAVLTSADLDRALGRRATFVQFSAATCAACPQVNRLLTDLVTEEPGVIHVDLDAVDHLDLVRRLGVYRTPTVLLIDADGAVRMRTSGPLTPAHALAALRLLSHDAPRRLDA